MENLYVTSAYSDKVVRFNGATGAYMDDFVSYQSGGLDYPIDLKFGTDGHLYVTTQDGAAEVFKFDGTTGDFIGIFTSGLTDPTGLLFAPVSGCEICGNGIDDDGDGDIDENDADCNACIPTNLNGVTINPISGSDGFQILTEGDFTFNEGPHIHGPLAVGGNLIINTPSQAEVNMDLVGSYVFPGDGSTSSGLLVSGGINWNAGVVSVKNGKYIHIGDGTGCTESDNGVNMSTQVLPKWCFL